MPVGRAGVSLGGAERFDPPTEFLDQSFRCARFRNATRPAESMNHVVGKTNIWLAFTKPSSRRTGKSYFFSAIHRRTFSASASLLMVSTRTCLSLAYLR